MTTSPRPLPALAAPVILSANLLVNRAPAKVKIAARRHLALHSPRVACFQEAGGYVPQLQALARELGYRRPIHAPASAGRGMNSNVLQVRTDVDVYATGVAYARAPWIGPRLGIHWSGRAFPWAIVDDYGRRILVVCVHMPTEGRGRNALAWAVCKRRLRRLVGKYVVPGIADGFVLVGDWNQRRTGKGPGSIHRMAKRLDARTVAGGSPIDYAVARGIALDGVRGAARGSDHPSTIYVRKEAIVL